MNIDSDRPLTPFQRRVLLLLRALGPISFHALRPHFDEQHPHALRFALWRLTRGGWACRSLDREQLLSVYDCTDAGRAVLRERLTATSSIGESP